MVTYMPNEEDSKILFCYFFKGAKDELPDIGEVFDLSQDKILEMVETENNNRNRPKVVVRRGAYKILKRKIDLRKNQVFYLIEVPQVGPFIVYESEREVIKK